MILQWKLPVVVHTTLLSLLPLQAWVLVLSFGGSRWHCGP
jgi:hypothetical protein